MSLKRFDYMTRRQLQMIHNLKGDRNANRILNDMDQYLHSFRHGMEKVYYLSKEGRERIKAKTIRKKTPNVQHFLLRNQLWIHLKCPASWKNEVRIKVGDKSIVCDAMYQNKGSHVFVEVDISQPMAVNMKKIERYHQIRDLTKQEFYLIWVTELESRRSKLKELAGDLPCAVYTLNEIL